MALIHTIQIAEEKKSGSTVSSTRKSENRRYTACIVATTTEATIAWYESALENAAAKKAGAEARIALLTEKLGMTVEAAKAKMDEMSTAWFKAFFDAKTELRGGTYKHVTDAEGEALARKNGAVNPYKNEDGSKSDLALLNQAAHDLHAANHNLKVVTPKLGSQAVLSWHHTVALAHKAMASHDHIARRGDKLEVRTDIEVTETKKRAKKESA